MRTFILAIFLLFADFAFSQNEVYNMPAIPLSGLTTTLSPYQNPSVVYVGTGGSAVNLGSNSYTLSYSSQPPTGTGFILYFDATQLTAIASHVTLFGTQPLVQWPNQGKYAIRFDYNGSTTTITYLSSMLSAGTISGGTKIYGSSQYQPGKAIVAGQVVKAADDSGTLAYGCIPWCTSGNTGNPFPSFVGNIDTAALRFRVDNLPSGIIDAALENSAFGALSLQKNTSGLNNSALGTFALQSNTTGTSNTAVGESALYSNTTGNYNTSIGENSLPNLTGSYNSAVGYHSLTTNSTGTYNTAIGAYSTTAASATSYGLALGSNAIASSNQLAISPNIENLYWSGHPSGVGYALVDSSGTGNFIPTAPYLSGQTYFTPVTGDSITPFTGSNLINPAGTLTNLTICVPANPTSGQIMEFSFTQTISSIHWSIALNQTHSVFASVPTTVTQGGTIKIQYNPNTSTWYSW